MLQVNITLVSCMVNSPPSSESKSSKLRQERSPRTIIAGRGYFGNESNAMTDQKVVEMFPRKIDSFFLSKIGDIVDCIITIIDTMLITNADKKEK